MKDLSELQKDALIEICNVGMAKAATQLSVLLNSKVELTIPELNMSRIEDVVNRVNAEPDDTITYVSQRVQDSLNGTAVVIYNSDTLTNALSPLVLGGLNSVSRDEARACEREAVIEISNVIISSCISSIADFLKLELDLSVPEYSEDILSKSIVNILSSAEINSDEAIGFLTILKSESSMVEGTLALVINSDSVNNLLISIDRLLGGEV